MVMGSAEEMVDGRTVHLTRMVPPPPFTELLHWVMVALVVFAGKGSQAIVGSVPPPAPEPLHWLTVAGEVSATPVMLFVTVTVQLTLPPPPLPEPLHTSTDVTTSPEVVVVGVPHMGAPAGPRHGRTVTVEVVTPVARSRLLTMVTSHRTSWPPTFPMPLHWLTAVVAASAGLVVGGANINNIPTTTSMMPRRRAGRVGKLIVVSSRPRP